MSVSKISMGETQMVECHYKFGVYDEPLPEREEPTNTDIEQDSSVFFLLHQIIEFTVMWFNFS